MNSKLLSRGSKEKPVIKTKMIMDEITKEENEREEMLPELT